MRIHIVKKGDTLYSLGKKYGVSLEGILKLNPGIANADAIEVGMKLKIPSNSGGAGSGTGGMDHIMHQHVVKQGDTLWKLSKAWGIPLADMIKANSHLKNPNVLLTGEIVNIPKAGAVIPDAPSPNAPNKSIGQKLLHPGSIMQGVQGLAGKLSTAPAQAGKMLAAAPAQVGKMLTAPLMGKTPTAPIEGEAPGSIEPAPDVTPVPPTPIEPEMKPIAPLLEENEATAPILSQAAVPPSPIMAKDSPKKALPISKPVEKKVKPSDAEFQPIADLFKQYGVPATEAMSLYDLPKAPEAMSQTAQPGGFGYGQSHVMGAQAMPAQAGFGYGQPQVLPAQSGHGFGQPQIMPAQAGHGYGQPQVLPAQTGHGYGYGYGYGNPQVMPLQAGHGYGQPQALSPYDCPPGTVYVGHYQSPAFMPMGMGTDYGQSYGHNQPMVSPQASSPNEAFVSPLSTSPNEAFVSPLSSSPNEAFVSPLSTSPNEAFVSPLSTSPNEAFVSPLSTSPNEAFVSPLSTSPNQAFVSPLSASPNQGLAPQANVHMHANHGYGYGYLSGYPYSNAGFTQNATNPPYPVWPQAAGVGANMKDCGCKGNRETEETAKKTEVDPSKPVKTAVKRKAVKKAVIRSAAQKNSTKKNRGNQPWLNR